MADDNKNKAPKPPGVISSSFSKGLHLDSPISTQPEGTYRWALNAIQETESGELGFISNEVGNFECADFGNQWSVIGGLYLKDSEFIVFLAPNSDTYEGHGKIVKVNKDCGVETLIWSNCLNFKINKQIQAVQRILNGCEINIYFTDNNNDIRHLNINSLEDYLKSGLTINEIDVNNPDIWDCERMKLWPDFRMATIDFVELNESGSLDAGVYQFAVQYVDKNLNTTNWSPITQPIPVYLDNVTNSALSIKGNNLTTSKAIVLRLGNLDTSFSYIRIAVIPSTDNTGQVNGDGYIFRDIAIPLGVEDSVTSVPVSIDRLDKDDVRRVSIEQINTPRKIYQTAKTLTQIKNRLVLGNLKETIIDHSKFQHNANNIEINYVTKTLSAEDATKDSVQSGSYYFDNRTYMRDEIYALGIVWVFKDGTETFAYHIPGREKDKYPNGGAIDDYGDPNNPLLNDDLHLASLGWPEHNRPWANTGWDTTEIIDGGGNAAQDYLETENMNVHHYVPNTITGNGSIERWEIYNTAIRTGMEILNPPPPGFAGALSETHSAYVTRGIMSYYECRFTRYPSTVDCDGKLVYPYKKAQWEKLNDIPFIDAAFDAWENGTGDGYYINYQGDKKLAYQMDFIRHHKMPDTTLEPHQHGDMNIKNSGMQAFTSIKKGQTEREAIGPAPKIVTLGIEASNIQPPAEYANLIQGYRIVRAEQGPDDKTVIDKGIIYYNHFAFKFWQGGDTVSGDFNQCAWMQQGNYYNKHMTSFACVRGGYRNMKSASYGVGVNDPQFGDATGQIGICSNNVYSLNYNAEQGIVSGFTANFGMGGGNMSAAPCLVCNNQIPDWGSSEDWFSLAANTALGMGSIAGAWLINWMGAIYDLFSEDNGGGNVSYMNMLTQQDGWYKWLGEELGQAGLYHDALAWGQGYPNAAWGWLKDGSDSCSTLLDVASGIDVLGGGNDNPIDVDGFDLDERTDQEGINVGYTQDIIVYPNASVSYHGPMAKFGKITNAEYVKVERVLIGYTQNIICNTACCSTDDGAGTHRASNDFYSGSLTGGMNPNQPSWAQATGTNYFPGADDRISNKGRAGIGNTASTGRGQRFDGNATYIYTRASYHHSGVPYLNSGSGIEYMYDPVWLPEDDRLGDKCKQVGGNDSHPKNAWDPAKYPMYGFPLCNIRIDDYMQLDAFQQVHSLNFGDVPFDNNTAMECMPVSFKTKRNEKGKKKWFRLPYPGNNFGYNRFIHTGVIEDVNSGYYTGTSDEDPRTNAFCTNAGDQDRQFPIDSSFSTMNCDRLENWTWNDICDGAYNTEGKSQNKLTPRGRITTYYVAMKKNSYDAYSNINSLVYHSTHNNLEFIDKANPYKKLKSDFLFGGDSFVSRFAFKHTQYNSKCGNEVINAQGENKYEGTDFPIPSCNVEGQINNHGIDNQIPPDTLTIAEYAGGDDNDHPQFYRIGVFNHISWYWTESYINTELRTGEDRPDSWFYPYHFEGNNSTYGALKFVDPLDYHDTGWGGGPFSDPNSEIKELPQSFTMNPDYNKQNTENFYLSAPKEFDFCNDCFERHPYRVAYSEQSFQEQQNDNYGEFLTMNYRDIPSHKGEIWNMFELNNSLFIHTEESMWNVEPARNMVATDASTIYIGTGDFFSEEVREIIESSTGYLGAQSQWATLVSEAGVFWPDFRQGAVYLQTKQPENISNKGLKNWFQENMEVSIYNQYQDIYGEPFPAIDNPANPAGAGYLSVYDGRHNRLILTKKDYVLRAPFNTTDSDDPYYQVIKMQSDYGHWEVSNTQCDCRKDNLYGQYEDYQAVEVWTSPTEYHCEHSYTDENGAYYKFTTSCKKRRLNINGNVCETCEDIENENIKIPLNPGPDGRLMRPWEGKISEIFECRNWTVSYAILSSAWSSWHSYFPNYYLAGKDFFLSGNNHMSFPDADTDLTTLSRLMPSIGWKHDLNSDHSNYQSYYGCIKPHIIEMATTSNPTVASVAESLHFITDASMYKEDTKEYVDQRYTTFESGYLYNSYQTTGTLNFTVKDTDIVNMSVTSITENLNSCLIDRKERVWGINGFRDMAIDRDTINAPSLFSSKWEDTESEYYIDKVINPLAIDSNKNWFERARLLDKYLAIRLFFSNLANPGKHKLVTNFLLGVVKQSSR